MEPKTKEKKHVKNINRAYSDNDDVSLHAYDNLDNANSNVGDGNRDGMQFADADPNSGYSKKILSQCNVINSTDSEYAGNSANVWERTSVDVSRADRGKES